MMATIGVAVVVKAGIIMFLERDYWHQVDQRRVKNNIVKPAARGNILSTDGKLMSSSIPEYKVYLDYITGETREKKRQRAQFVRDSILETNLDSICRGMHRIFPEYSVAILKAHIKKGRNSAWKHHYNLLPNKSRRVSYIQYNELKKLPLFNLSQNRGGFHREVFNQRKRPFGSLAKQTIGSLYSDTAKGAYSGIELAFDSLLKGRPGIVHKQKVKNRQLQIVDRAPVDGCDIVTTIDVSMQDICETALVEKLHEINAHYGVAVLMEVETGEVKALVNMDKGKDGNYYEMENHAISDMLEPGSTFKTASIMVALEDGFIDPHTQVDTGNGQMMMHGSRMKDHNWSHGGYGVIDVTRILEVSSNIGVSYLIDKYYRDNPQRFVDGLKRMSLDQPLHLQIRGEGKPYIRGPKERPFYGTTLPWMSIGYETQVPPINILTFYNAIANNGKMVRPKLVKAAVKDGHVIEEYPTEVINPKICSDRTLEQIREILRKVVSQGLAKPAGSKQFSVSGKTGTAQVSQGASGYTNGRREYLVSFCGYFPSEAPKYSLIVSIRKPGLPASGGLMAGSVFGKIAERVYAHNLRLRLEAAIDSTSVVIPDVKAGLVDQTREVLSALNISTRQEGGIEGAWSTAQVGNDAVLLSAASQPEGDQVPKVIGMGARDALYLLESAGMKVQLSGVGRVKRQSLPPGTNHARGRTIQLTLGN